MRSMKANPDGHKLTHLLQQSAQGDKSASDELIAMVYDELLWIAEQRMTQERPAGKREFDQTLVGDDLGF